MEKKQRIICFYLNTASILLIIAAAYFNYKLYSNSVKTYDASSLYFWFLAFLLLIFICSILLQGEQLLTIIRRRKALLIRWELFLPGVMAISLALINIWFRLLFPSPETNDGIIIVLLHGILVSQLGNVVFVLTAGVFFVSAFHAHDIIMKKRQRGIWLIWSIATIVLIAGIVFFNHNLWHILDDPNSLSNFYIQYFVNLISAFVCSLLLQGENISTIISRRKTLLIRWELIILGIVAIVLALMKIWVIILTRNFITLDEYNASLLPVISHIISLNEFWNGTLMFAAGILFVRAFYIKIDLIDFGDNLNEL